VMHCSKTRIEKKLPWRAYRHSPTLFRTEPSPTPYGLFFPKTGVRNPTQNSNRCYLRKGRSYGLQIWPEHSQGPSEQKPIQHFGEKGAWAYPETAHIFGHTLLSQERLKLRNSNFEGIFVALIGKKPIKNSGKVAVGIVRDSRKFSGHS